MKIKLDWISALLIIALMATLIAFYAGIFPYPYGFIVITLLLVFRMTAGQEKE